MARSTSITFELDRAAIARQLNGPNGVAPRYLQQRSRAVTFAARFHCPVGRTGALGRSIRTTTVARRGDFSVVRISAQAYGNNGRDYAPFVTKGTIGADISAKTAKAMVFERTGGRIGNQARRDRFGLRRVREGTGNFVVVPKPRRVRGQAANNFLLAGLEDVAAADPTMRIINRG